ncbi:phosphoribosylamine--glycine ligase, partial [Micrococcus sp. HSID17245]
MYVVVIMQLVLREKDSVIVLADGQHIVQVASSQVHMFVVEGAPGPTVGGRGAYSTVPLVNDDFFFF